jgi:histidinol phosphatase-like enzyme (inositol monophosphatase family)
VSLASATLAPERLEAFEAFALELATVAAEAILPLFRAGVGVEDKGHPDKPGVAAVRFDPVTAADRGAEAAIRKAIAARFPDHGVIGEEYGEDRPDAAFVWVLDPIDGTRAFIAGIPLWTTLIALRFQGAPVVGLIGQPYLDEAFVGSAAGARLVRRGGARALRVRPCAGLADASVGVTDPLAYFTAPEQAAFARVRAAARLTRLGGDAYFFALAALGTLDLVVEPAACKAWDIEAAIPLMHGAGGIMTDWRGDEIGSAGGQVLLAGDPRCHEQAMRLLESEATRPPLP